MISYQPQVHEVGQYAMSYSSLHEDYLRYSSMDDAEFLDNAISILHFSCFVCFVKELRSERVLSDNGVIHELIHLIDPATNEAAVKRLSEIREIFNRDCRLA
jgi:hypothetical protein